MATLEQVAHINDLSVKTRKELVERVKSYGRYVKYKFDIVNKNPDPEKYNGEFIVPGTYSLDPRTFDIIDKNETRENKASTKTIGLVGRKDDKGIPNFFEKVRLYSHDRAELEFDTQVAEQLQWIYYLEMHPKNKNSMFPDPSKHPVFERVNEVQYSEDARTIRSAKHIATGVAMNMSEKELRQYADAMMWDSNLFLGEEGLGVLRDKVELAAETDPKTFTDLVESKKIEYLAAIKVAIDKKAIIHNASENTFCWMANNNVIFMTSNLSAKAPNEQFAEWLMIGDDKSKEVFKKIKEVIK